MVETVALLLGREPRGWFRRALETVERETGARVTLVVRTDGGETAPGLPDAEVRTVSVPDSGRVSLPASVCDRLAETDVAVTHDTGILTGDVLEAPTHGVLGYHHGDLRRYRGAYVHLWNYLDRVDTGGVTVMRLTEELDAGHVVAECEVDLTGAITWSELEQRKHAAGVDLLATAISNLEDPAFEPTVIDEADLGPMYRSSDVSLGTIAHYAALETARTGFNRLKNVRGLLDIWRG